MAESPTMHPCRPVGLDWVDRAPAVFRNSVTVALSPDELFAVLARADTWPRWAKVITDVAYTSPEPHGVGTTRTVTMRGGLVADEEFLAWDPGHTLAFRFSAASVPALRAFVEVYTIVPSGGGSEVTWTVAQETTGVSRRLGPLTRPLTDLGFRWFLRNLQRLTADGVPGAVGL